MKSYFNKNTLAKPNKKQHEIMLSCSQSKNILGTNLIQVAVSPSYRKLLRQIAAKEDRSIRSVVLSALADKYPQLSAGEVGQTSNQLSECV
jgi:hypothetical protein